MLFNKEPLTKFSVIPYKVIGNKNSNLCQQENELRDSNWNILEGQNFQVEYTWRKVNVKIVICFTIKKILYYLFVQILKLKIFYTLVLNVIILKHSIFAHQIKYWSWIQYILYTAVQCYHTQTFNLCTPTLKSQIDRRYHFSLSYFHHWSYNSMDQKKHSLIHLEHFENLTHIGTHSCIGPESNCWNLKDHSS